MLLSVHVEYVCLSQVCIVFCIWLYLMGGLFFVVCLSIIIIIFILSPISNVYKDTSSVDL